MTTTLNNIEETISFDFSEPLLVKEFDYNITCKEGTLKTNADALSRLEIHTTEINNTDNLSILVNPDTDTEHVDQNEDENSISQQIETPQDEKHDNTNVQTLKKIQ